MQFRDLQKQYQVLKKDMDAEIQQVLTQANFISGAQVSELEQMLADYVGVKHCITCANGTDALLWHLWSGILDRAMLYLFRISLFFLQVRW